MTANRWSLAAHRNVLARASAETIVIIDGYEQLSFWNKWRIRWLCHRRGSGLLVTTHVGGSLPLLMFTKVDPATAEAVFGLLVPGTTTVDRSDLAKALAAHPDDLRTKVLLASCMTCMIYAVTRKLEFLPADCRDVTLASLVFVSQVADSGGAYACATVRAGNHYKRCKPQSFASSKSQPIGAFALLAT